MLFTDDFILAKIEPILEYNPNAEIPAEELANNPEKYARQALFIGTLERVVHKMIVTDANGNQRCINYDEFESAYYTGNQVVADSFKEVAALLHNFHPKTRPVFGVFLLLKHIFTML